MRRRALLSPIAIAGVSGGGGACAGGSDQLPDDRQRVSPGAGAPGIRHRTKARLVNCTVAGNASTGELAA